MVRRVAPHPSVDGDQIRQLPVEILDHIMGLLPIQEAAKTAVLSKLWGDVWSSLTQLCFDYNFFRYFQIKHRKEGKYFKLSSCLYAINKVLLQHKGPIKKFVFLFPGGCPLIVRSRSYDMNQWLLLVTQQGVEEIRLCFGSREYKLPECIFSSSTLKRLHLSGLCIAPQISPCTSPNLTSLCFKEAKFLPRNTTNYSIDVPKLENLSFYCCENISHFNIIARNLRSLRIARHSTGKGDNFLPVNIDLRSIHTLDLEGSSHEDILGDHTSNGLPPQLPALNVKSLKLSGDYFLTDAAFVCLLRKCPKLCKLKIHFQREWDMSRCIDATSGHFEKLRCVAQTHKMLWSLKFWAFNGSKPQMHFIKEMLANLPALEKVVIIYSLYMFDRNKKHDILEEISHFPCASPKAKIAYQSLFSS
ncbi:unnamed protein product [Cuscuta campestris]|uniref:F-box domain-containing protein n=1 Tax=Cuscuta campestris TaxID=132261 RepID=A0A484N5T0_9ASTE|nr:unnamed protein product [Cuscuta campestris]